MGAAFRYFTVLLALVLTAAFLWFVWPTRYRYEHLKDGISEAPVRIDRLTGRAEGLTATSGWVPLGKKPVEYAHLKELEPSELQRLEARCSVDNPFIECSVYNALSCTLEEVTITFLPPYPPRSLRLTRKPYEHGDPLQVTKFTASFGDFAFFDANPPPKFFPEVWWKITGGLAVCGSQNSK